jgi:hypothetical protein
VSLVAFGRTDISSRTMTEILRVQEDVATLRAIVSPMRLQVLADRPGSSQRIHRPIQITRASASDHGSLPTPPLSSSHSFLGPDESDDDHLASLSIRESVVFSEQDAGPRIHRSSHSSLVATATAAGSTRPPAAREWTGRPCAFPAEPPQPQQQLRTGRLGSLGRLSASLLGIQRDASPRL